MVGMILWKTPETGKRQKAVTIRERSVLHVRFLCAEVLKSPRTPEGVLKRRALRAGKRLKNLGAARTVLPEDFPWRRELSEQGVQIVSSLALRRLLAADWVRWDLAQRGVPEAGARVAVTARVLTGDVVRTVTELSLRHRYVLVELPAGGEELAARLRREYGVSLLLSPGREQLEGAQAVAVFDGKAVPPLRPGRLFLGDEEAPMPPLEVPPALEKMLPEGADRRQLLTVLREAGAIRPGQITIGDKKG